MSLGDKARELLAAFPPAYWQALAVVMALYLVSRGRSSSCWQGPYDIGVAGRVWGRRRALMQRNGTKHGAALPMRRAGPL